MKRKLTLVLTLTLILLQGRAQSSFDREFINVGQIGLSLTNAGTVGWPDVRNNPQGPPSMEYPLNSGIEHLFEGGLWIGAKVNGQTAVSTASVDFPTGYTTGASGFEFTAEVGQRIRQRSTLTNSDYFSFDAVSHQDMVMDFSDRNVVVPGTSIPIENHDLPLGAQVHLEAYAWNFSFADFFVILDITITNTSTSTWDSVYFGYWTDMVVRNINVATDGGAAFFNKGGGGYIDSLYAIYAFDVTGDPGYTNSYGASQFLGLEWRNRFVHPNTASDLAGEGFPRPKVNANFWVFRQFDGSQFGAPANDIERYEKMAKGLNFNDPALVEMLQNPSNRTQLLSFGPLKSIEPGETVKLAWGFVCARQLETGGSTGPEMDTRYARTELRDHLGWAQRTYFGEDLNGNGALDPGEDIDGDQMLDRYILPEPPTDPKVHIVSMDGKIKIYWDASAEESIDPVSKIKDFEGYRIYRTNPGDDRQANLDKELNLIAQFDKEENEIGFNNGFDAIRLDDPITFEGDSTVYTYLFELDNVLNGWQYEIVVTAFDRGNRELNIPSLESSFVANSFRAWAGTPVNESPTAQEIGVYPNPYIINAAWDGSTPQTRKLYFYNLPARCEITVYTVSGDVVAVIDHDAASYRGEDIQWFANFGGAASKRITPGGEHAWDILTNSKQTITQGLYLYTVKDLSSGVSYSGRFAVLK